MVTPKKNRKSPRAQVSLVARYRSPTAFEFVQEECFDLSLGGMFIRSPAPAPAGTLIKLECDVNGAAGTIRGVARVVWLREHSSDGQPAGMGVKFVKLDSGAREVIANILEQLGADREDRDTARPPPPEAGAAQPFKQTPSARPNTKAAKAEAAVASTSAPSTPSTPSRIATTTSSATATTTSSTTATTTPSTTATTTSSTAQAEIGPLSDSGRPAARDLRGRLEQAKRIQVEQEAAVARASGAQAPAEASATSDAPASSASSKRPRASARSAERAVQPAPDVTTVSPLRPNSNKGLAYALVALVTCGVLFVVLSRKPAPVNDANAATMQREPAARAIEKPPAPAAYVLDVATTPDGARITAGARALTAPGQLELGQLEEPVQLTVEKEGFEPTTATIDRVGFMLEDGAMRRRIALTLTARAAEAVPEPQPVAQPKPEPAPARAPAPAAKVVAKAQPKPEAKPARRPRQASAEAKPKPSIAPTEPAPAATAPTETPVPAAAPVAAVEPKPEAAPPPPVLTIAPAGEAKPVAEAKPAPEPKPAPEAKAAEPKPADAKLTPMQAAAACLSTGDNACVVKALEGKAKSAQELELLIETYKAMGDSAKAEKWMKTYIDKYPTERRTNAYRRVLDRPKEQEAAAP